jgi:hypothetical protein
MDADPRKPLPAFGFLTVVESSEHGMFGGYLVLSPLGRPLEFRCSTPIAPSRAHEILYGPTLRPYLLAEVIGQALVSGSELPVQAILTDQRDMLPLALLRHEPVLHVAPATGADADVVAGLLLAGNRVTCGETVSLALSSEELRALLEPLAAHVDLCEPFGRICAALAEAQMASHDQAESTDDRAAAA